MTEQANESPMTIKEWVEQFRFMPMTEQEWLGSSSINEMLDLLQGRLSDRKTRLFAVACCRRQWTWFTDPRCRYGVELAERLADEPISSLEVRQAFDAAESAYAEASQTRVPERWAGLSPESNAASATRSALSIIPVWAFSHAALIVASEGEKLEAEHARQATIFRDIYGNPFLPVTLNPSWLTSTVEFLAKGIYDDRAFDFECRSWAMRSKMQVVPTRKSLGIVAVQARMFAAAG